MKQASQTMQNWCSYITLNKYITNRMMFYGNFIAFQSNAPTRITEQIGKMLQIAETKTVLAIFVIPLSGKITHIVRFSSEQIVNSLSREQFCSRFQIAGCNYLIFCVFLRFTVHKVGLSYASAGSEPHF